MWKDEAARAFYAGDRSVFNDEVKEGGPTSAHKHNIKNITMVNSILKDSFGMSKSFRMPETIRIAQK